MKFWNRVWLNNFIGSLAIWSLNDITLLTPLNGPVIDRPVEPGVIGGQDNVQ
jgi:hypothetical protein